MTEIDVPDWVVEIYRRVYRENFVDGRLLKVDERVHRALTAALGAWVVPAQFQARARFMGSDWSLWRTFDYPHDRDSDFDRMNNADGWQAERRDLFTLRQEKPE